MNSDQIWNLLAKFFSGEASSREEQLIEEWLSKSEENKKVFKLLQKVWARKSHSGSLERVDVDKLWLETWDKLESHDFTTSRSTQVNRIEKQKEQRQQVFPTAKIIQYAAAAVFLLAALFAGIFLYPYQDEAFSESLVHKTDTGETQHIRLDDGSEVWLAPKSTLSVPADYKASSRELKLEGEAYFSVESRQDSPFWVYTKNSITKVLGTQFNVKALADESLLEVLVTEGTVAVEKGNRDRAEKDIILNKGDLLKTDEALDDYEVMNSIQTLSYLKWKEGVIHLDDLSLDRIEERLERWYPVDIVLQSEGLATKKLTAEFSSSQPLGEILDAISLALDIEYKRDQGTVIFYE